MTVVGYDPEDSLNVTCTWFNNNAPLEKSFHQDLLLKTKSFRVEDFFDLEE